MPSFMLTTSFAYFISFLIFVFFAYKYGHKKMRAVLDTKITAIADSLIKANAEKEEAQLVLSALKQELREFDQVLKAKDDEIVERIATLQENHKKQLNDLINEREKHHLMLLDFEKQTRMTALKEELTTAVLNELKTTLLENQNLRDAFEKKSFTLLENHLSKKPEKEVSMKKSLQGVSTKRASRKS